MVHLGRSTGHAISGRGGAREDGESVPIGEIVGRTPVPLKPHLHSGSGFRVQGSGFRVQGAGFRVQGAGFKVQGAGFRVQGAGFRVQGLRALLPGC